MAKKKKAWSGRVGGEAEAGKISFDLSQEDVHMGVEQFLTRRLGKMGGKLHTGRSRNDQVALDLRLFLRDSIDDIVLLIAKVKEAILARAEEVFGVVMPGYTHVQRAQPVLLSHHLLAYHEMFSRDQDRILCAPAEFGFPSLPDALCTGSSIMPQKKNPDVPELIRGKAGRTYGNLVNLLTVMKGLPLAYNRDMQEDQEPVFDSARTVKESLIGAALLLRGMTGE